jgi:type IV pilus assembly protein PilP
MKFLSLIALAALALAQPTPTESPQQVVESTAKAPNPDIETLTIENTMEMRDPFRRPLIKAVASEEENKNLPELERFDLEQFKLVGVITGALKNKALISTPNGKMHVVSENMHIGTRKGVIKKVSVDSILVQEKVINILGKEEKMDVMLQFKKDEAAAASAPANANGQQKGNL